MNILCVCRVVFSLVLSMSCVIGVMRKLLVLVLRLWVSVLRLLVVVMSRMGSS